jgi:universal stress protein A
MLPLHSILCPIDFSESSLKALETAIELAESFDATVHVLHVLESLPSLSEAEDSTSAKSSAYLHRIELEDRIRLSMIDTIENYGKPTIKLFSMIESGSVAKRILRISQQISADVIVISTHGRRGWNRLVFGSVAEEVIRKALCPVLTLRPVLDSPISSCTE